MPQTQEQKAEAFRALHEGEPFIIPNPWDAGSARVLERLGFKALATTSSGFAFTLGRRDGETTLDEVTQHVRMLSRATELPVSVDLENGYGSEPRAAAAAISAAAGAGAVGGSIEDYDPAGEIYDVDHAVGRVAAAAEAARGLRFPFVLTARAEGFLRGRADLDDVIKRLKAYEAAGADVLFAPGLPDLAAVKKVCSSIGKPFNFMVGIKGRSFSVVELEAAGVKRISLATSLYKAAMTGLMNAAKEVKDKGTFTYLDTSISTPDLNAFMKE
jgi:2-methylisocitrate lyase-like PEP mutase family enzyme